jgi:hypothetical protein
MATWCGVESKPQIAGFVDEETAARTLGVKRTTLQRWRRLSKKSGRQIGPPWTYAGIGRQVIYNSMQLVEWVHSNMPVLPRPPKRSRRVAQLEVMTAP